MMRKSRMVCLMACILAMGCTADKKQDTRPAGESEINNIPISMQCWTFRRYTLFEAIEKTAALGIGYLEAFPGQKLSPEHEVRFDHNLDDSWLDLVKDKLDQQQMKLVAYGVVGFDRNREAMERVFDFAEKMGIRTVITEPAWDDYSSLSEIADEYGIRIAVHNHPDPNKYARPGTVLERVKNRSPLLGACGDTGHWMRTGVVPVEALKMLEGRVMHMHLKDLDRFGVKDALDVPFGSGKADIRGILAELTRQKYDGYLSIEHENPNEVMNPEPAIRKGLDYIRSVTNDYK